MEDQPGGYRHTRIATFIQSVLKKIIIMHFQSQSFTCPICGTRIFPEQPRINDGFDRHQVRPSSYWLNIPEYYPVTCPNGAELEFIPLAGSTEKHPIYYTNVIGLSESTGRPTNDSLFDTFKRNALLEIEQTVRLKLIKYQVPKRYRTSRRIRKKTLRKRGLPYYYYDKKFLNLEDLRPCEKRRPMMLKFRAYTRFTEGIPVDLTPPRQLVDRWNEVVSERWAAPVIAILTFSTVGLNRQTNFEQLSRMSGDDLTELFWRQAYHPVIKGVKYRLLGAENTALRLD